VRTKKTEEEGKEEKEINLEGQILMYLP